MRSEQHVTLNVKPAVWGNSLADAWAGGEAGALLSWDGDQWSDQLAPVPRGTALRFRPSIVAAGDVDDVFVSDTRSAQHFDGTTWTSVDFGAGSDVASLSPDGSLLLGSDERILRVVRGVVVGGIARPARTLVECLGRVWATSSGRRDSYDSVTFAALPVPAALSGFDIAKAACNGDTLLVRRSSTNEFSSWDGSTMTPGPALPVGAFQLFAFEGTPYAESLTAFYRLDDDGWSELLQLPGGARGVQILAHDRIWIATISPTSPLLYFDGRTWRTVGVARCAPIQSLSATRDGAAWLADRNGVIRIEQPPTL